VGILALGLRLLMPGDALAGQDATLDAVDSLVSLGRADEARSTLLDWLVSNGSSASRREQQRSIWLRGILTVDPAQAAVDFQRLAVEFPAGEWTDDALLRLARYAEALGDVDEAARRYRDILRDHPAGPPREAAREWLDAHADVLARIEAEAGEPAVEEPRPAAPDEGEARESPAPGPEEEPSPAAEPGASTADWGVQLGAFSGTERARDLMARAREAGFRPRLVRVPGSDLLRVRIGRLEDAAAARVLADRAAARGFAVYVVEGVTEESPAGG
jgi:cell division septation protein DedD